MMKSFKSIDAHIASQPKATQALLKSLRRAILQAAPEAVETISYGIPTFDLCGHLVHFAGYPTHIGLYPGAAALVDFKKDFARYKTAKGTIQFPLDRPLPLPLIKKVVAYRVRANLEKAGRLFPKMSAPATRALRKAGIVTVKDLSKWSEQELLALHGFGPATLPTLRVALRAKGLSFKTKKKEHSKK